MPVQTTYSTEHAPAYEGMKATTSGLINTRSYFAEGSNIKAGRGVVFGTDGEKQCVLPATSSTAAEIAGITLYEVNRVSDNSGNTENEDRPVTLLTAGDIWVKAQNGASVSDSVFLVINAAGGNEVGTFRSTADAANTVQVPNAKFISAAASGGLAKISLNIG